MHFSFFRLHLSKLLRLSYLVLLHLSRKIISVNLSHPQPLSGTALMNRSLVLRLPREKISERQKALRTLQFCAF